MNIVEAFRENSDRVLDRLVDGELNPLDRQQLLQSLDDEPGGWRACSLAFLEAQNWRAQLSRVAHEPLIVAPPSSPIAVPTVTADKSAGLGLAAWLSIAAGVLVAFALGTQLGGRSGPPVGGASHDLALETNASGVDDQTFAGAGTDEIPEMITLSMEGDDNRVQTFKLPILNSSELDQDWYTNRQPTLPAGLIEELKALGLEVNAQQQLVPVSLPDGRSVLVPIDEFEIRLAQTYY